MRKIFLVITVALFSVQFLHAQVGINILIPDSSAVLQLESNNKGLGLSRLTTPQRDAIAAPLRGLTIFNTTDSFMEYWTGECWLRAYEKTCNDCDFRFSIDDATDTLDRIYEDSVFSTLTLEKLKSTHKINVIFLSMPPQGVQISFDGSSIIDSAGTLKIVVKADIFAGDGLVPIVIQAFCGDQVKFLTYNVYIEPCVRVTIPADTKVYDLQAQNPIDLPLWSRKCVVLTVNNSVSVTSDSSTIPAYTTGKLDSLSKVGIINNGYILGRGGDGGGFVYSGNTFTVGGTPGAKGGNAISLTTRTIIKNYGAIYGAGGGGGSVGLLIQSPSLPLVGSIAIGVGFGGGGGSETGKGGAVPSGALNIGIFNGGSNATAGVYSVPGVGGVGNVNVPITINPLTVNINPTANGGNGGPFGQPGTSGYLDVSITACVAIPIIGSVCVPIPIPGGFLPYFGPAGGQPGNAIKRNGQPLVGITDGSYSSSQIKGVVGP